MADITDRRAGARGEGVLRRLERLLEGGADAAGRLRRLALGLSAVWLVLVAAYAIGLLAGPGPEETGRPIAAVDIALLLFAVLAPVTLTLFGFAAASALSRMSAEAAALRSEMAGLRQTGGEMRPNRPAEQEVNKLLTEMRAERAALAEALREAAARARSGELPRANPAPAPEPAPEPAPTRAEHRPQPAARAPRPGPAAPAPQRRDAEPTLPLDPPPADARPALDWETMVVAMEFPDSETDRRTIEALYKVLPDPMAARLLQSAEDALTILAGEGLYMDDLTAESASEQDWTRYLDGARGREADAIGAITDETALERTRARLKRDRVFNDAALHFLLRYDSLAKRARGETGSDAFAPRMAATRTGKAYALLTRALGRFDR